MFARFISLFALLGLSGLAACGDNVPPHMHDIEAQTAYVGSRLEFKVYASDTDGGRLIFTAASPTLSLERARLLHIGNSAVFNWTPLATNVGQHQIDFTVTDGDLTDVASTTITVKPSTDPNTAPIFRKPLGEGTTLDLASQNCITLEIMVEDSDSVKVDITQSPPINGAKLQHTGTHRALFNWCPTKAQSSQPVHILRLVADDHDNAQVRKNYTILLRSDLPKNCPGAAPVIKHTPPMTQKTIDPIKLTATITDDKGLKGAPTVYHSTTKPADPTKLDYSSLSQVAMTRGSTDLYSASLPNPTSSLKAGESKTIYYVIVAEDDDDASGSCDHRTQAPANALFQVVVTKPQGTTPCTTDAQCKSGQVCDGTSCLKDTCTSKDTDGDKFHWDQNGCPTTKHFCPVKGPGISPSHCALSCDDDSDCKIPGYACKVFDTKEGCGKAGSKTIGQACNDFTECTGKAMCMPLQGGYCTISDCDSYGSFSGACPAGAACVPVPDPRFKSLQKHWLCYKTCKDNNDCRASDGYTCKTVTDDQGTQIKACM
jgi:hypothetical protein